MSCLTIKEYGELNIVYTMGDGIFIQWVRTDLDDNPIDVTGFTYTFSIRPDKGDTPILTIPTTVTDGPNGVFVSQEIPANLTLLTEPVYSYDLEELPFGSTMPVTRVKGVFIVEEE